MTAPLHRRMMTPAEQRLARRGVSRRHGRPMMCPECGGDVFIDGPHICPPGFVKPAREVLTFYGYRAVNACCRSNWLLLGWPQVNGRPKYAPEGQRQAFVYFDCPQCRGFVSFNVADPALETLWDQAVRGKPQPPALVAGEIRNFGG